MTSTEQAEKKQAIESIGEDVESMDPTTKAYIKGVIDGAKVAAQGNEKNGKKED